MNLADLGLHLDVRCATITGRRAVGSEEVQGRTGSDVPGADGSEAALEEPQELLSSAISPALARDVMVNSKKVTIDFGWMIFMGMPFLGVIGLKQAVGQHSQDFKGTGQNNQLLRYAE